MSKLTYFLLLLITISIEGQVGINTQTPETTLEVIGKPNDLTHYDGIIPPRITGNQLAAKTYSSAKKGAVVFITSTPTNLLGQVIQVTEPGLYCFDGNLWQGLSKVKQPVEYRILLTFEHNSTAGLAAISTWSAPVNYSGNTNAYLTASKYYTIGSKNFGGLKGFISFRKIHGIVNIKFQIYRSNDSAPISGDAFINIHDIYGDMGYIPNQIFFLHPENSTLLIPALLENYAIQIPQASLGALSTLSYTYGEVQGYSNWIKPYLP
ncbi:MULTISPECIES: hypothetical protein [unclassified Chryseobacterium]|uniref:hypothetical protein n=1 Tax=unclassified Chryseobacterium TaxID=2593645 RepID=UPI000D36B3C5|nr:MULTISPECIES: hypothetical protein [unclassified Chryseobacterium]PTT78456.1 hypothetical protein DBR25_00425 [Chryseobacterium sp. HMWF001]PVV54074.1 hypothetical protein DD829_18175 [Chryseobacterium sp. HMWF035]